MGVRRQATSEQRITFDFSQSIQNPADPFWLNTLGNFTVNPNAGLVFVDFEEGTTLQVIGKAKILWDEEDLKNKTGGTKRFWEIKIEHFLQIQKAHEQSWEFLDYSPHNPKTK